MRRGISTCNKTINPQQAVAVASVKLNSVIRKLPSSAKIYEPAVDLQARGSGTPLSLVHRGAGEILVFFGLSSYITGRLVCALRSRGFNGEP